MDELDHDSHPHGALWYSINRREIVAFGNDVIGHIRAGKRHIAIKAPVKSGKREIVEYLKVRCKELGMKHSLFYITALNRKDVKPQKAELELYGIETHCIRGEEECKKAIDAIKLSDCSISCIDESDYGSGARQKMAPLFTKFMDIVPHVFLYFSATIQETLASQLKTRTDFVEMEFSPPPTYRGAKWFYDNDLVFQPSPFFDKDDGGNISFTEHAYNVIRESMNTGRNVGVVRVTKIALSSFYPDAIKNDLQKKLNLLVPGAKPWKIEIGDEKHIIDWESKRIANGFIKCEDHQYLILINQTCTRGTDLKHWHRGLAFWHDCRPAEKSNANTLAQAFLRVSHYVSHVGAEGHPIRLYADERLIKYVITDNFEEYSASGGKAPTRTKKSTSRVGSVRTTTLVSTPASMYGSPTDEDSLEPAMTVPIIFDIDQDEYNSIKKVGNCYDESVKKLLSKPKFELLLDGLKLRTSMPKTADSIRKHITAYVDAAKRKQKYVSDVHKKDRKQDTCYVYIDATRIELGEDTTTLVVCIYRGSRIRDDQ